MYPQGVCRIRKPTYVATAAIYFPFSIPKSGRKRSAHGRRRFVQRFPGRQTKAVSFHRGNSPRIWRNSGFQIDSAVEEVFHILAGAFREKRNHHGGQQTGGEAGNDLVDIGGDRKTSQRISTAAPTAMPATVPPKVSRFQNRLSRMTGPKDAPKTPHAFSTRPMMEPELGSEAINRQR